VDLPDPGIKPGSLALQADSLPTELSRKPQPGFKDRVIRGRPNLYLLLPLVINCFSKKCLLLGHYRAQSRVLCPIHRFSLPKGGSDCKESTCHAGDLGLIPGWGRSPGGRNGNPLQYSCLENPMDRGTLPATVHGVTKSQTQLSDKHTLLKIEEIYVYVELSYFAVWQKLPKHSKVTIF